MNKDAFSKSYENYKEIFISSGDFSGDMHASFLVKNFKEIHKENDIRFSGIGGNLLEKENINFLFNMVDEQGFGFGFSLLKNIFRFRKIFNKIVKPYFEENKEKIKMVVLIDFYGYNIHIAKLAKSLGIKVVYYICPQIWASRKYRIKKIKKFVDFVIPILPFEKSLYEENQIECHYFGNPLYDIINSNFITEEKNVFNDEKNLIGIMPGSRLEEINKMLPIFINLINMLFEIAKIDKDFSNLLNRYEFVLILVENVYDKFCFDKDIVYFKNLEHDKKLDNILKKINFFVKKIPNLVIVRGPGYHIRSKMKFILTTSGTATLENTLLHVYMLIFYKVDFLSYFIAKSIIRTRFIGLPNILANKVICPEFIQKFDFLNIANDIKILMKKDSILNQKLDTIKEISKTLLIDNSSVIKQIVNFLIENVKNF